MSRAVSIVSEVESALHGASDARRGDVLRRVTDLFVGEAETITAEQTAVFDDVLGRLVSQIEGRALVELSKRLAPIGNAPLETVRALARHDDIEISGPILVGSERLSEADLIEIAKTKSNGHLAKISGRARLGEAVTDILVDRGDADVAFGLAENSGARFSQVGMAKLVMRADSDDRLTESVARRGDISPRLYRQLLAQATEVVRDKLLTTLPLHRRDTINQIVAEIAARAEVKPLSAQAGAEAQRVMALFSQDTEQLKAKIAEFARLKQTPKVIAGLALLTGLPPEQVERLFRAGNGFGLMVLCRTLALEWRAADAVISASLAASEEIEDLRSQYDALSIASAQRVFRFWQARQKVARHFQRAS
jgi:uncharacterized protein (DUF2336 family)